MLSYTSNDKKGENACDINIKRRKKEKKTKKISMHVIDLAVYVWRTHTTAQPFSVQKIERKKASLKKTERKQWLVGGTEKLLEERRVYFSEARSCQMSVRINICAKICA